MAWSLATGAAVTLSWWGVHTVLAGTVYDPPLALPIPAGASQAPDGGGGETASSTGRPKPSSAAPTATSGGSAGPTASPAASTPASASAYRPGSPAAGNGPNPDGDGGSGGRVKSYAVDGGRVVFDLGTTSAELVSATPASGWQMQVWKQPTWIRVTFTRNGRELSVFCVWHDTAPRVEIDER